MSLRNTVLLASLPIAFAAVAEPPDFADGIQFRDPGNVPLLEIDEPFAFIESEATVLDTDDFGGMWFERVSANGFDELPLSLQLDDVQDRTFNGITIEHSATLLAKTDARILRDGFNMTSKFSLYQNSSVSIDPKLHDPNGWIMNEGSLTTYAWIMLMTDVRANRDVIVDVYGFESGAHNFSVSGEGVQVGLDSNARGMISTRIYLRAGDYTFNQELDGSSSWTGGLVSCKFVEHQEGDMNLDGVLDFNDIMFFFSDCFDSDARVSDLDNDGDTDYDDWDLFLEIWRG